ncbi:hypothetical protein I4F81_010169 [Pyropia yezoensis]|uniref:Uncharacterized protein n=1 Tax=Pyropia yezoensis TaxID=2788 RepID=A0ACC3CBK5_PYRYE|nr:hypothetical protein I4F81_010169 [Neopyropia yezoensis]
MSRPPGLVAAATTGTTAAWATARNDDRDDADRGGGSPSFSPASSFGDDAAASVPTPSSVASSVQSVTFPASALAAARAASTLPVLGEERSWAPAAAGGELTGAALEATLRHVAVELSLSASKLPRAELLSKVDAFGVLFVGGVVGGAWDELGRTETIRDCHEPRWVAKFRLPGATALDRAAPIRVAVYAQASTVEVPGTDGVESPTVTSAPDLRAHTLLGWVELSLDTVLSAPGLCWDAPLRLPVPRGVLGLVTAAGPPSWSWGGDMGAGGGGGSGRPRGVLTIDADLIRHVHPPSTVTFGFGIGGGDNLARNRFQFVISRALRRGRWAAVYRSEPRVRAEACAFAPAVLPTDVLCGGELGRLLRLELYRYYLNGETALLGFVQVSMEKLGSMAEGGELYWWPSIGGITRAKVRLERLAVGEGDSYFGLRLTDM